MVEVQTVKIDGELVHFFDSAVYLYESSKGYTLELSMIVSEIVVMKYSKETNLIVEIEMQDGREFTNVMHIQNLPGTLPQLQLYCDVVDVDDYPDFYIVKDIDPVFPEIGKGITLADIRKIEMPDVKVKLTLSLPIDQAEWIAKQKKRELETIIKEAIYEYWKKSEN